MYEPPGPAFAAVLAPTPVAAVTEMAPASSELASPMPRFLMERSAMDTRLLVRGSLGAICGHWHQGQARIFRWRFDRPSSAARRSKSATQRGREPPPVELAIM